MKKLILSVAVATLIALSSCTNEVEKEVIKTVYVTPSGEELPDSLSLFFSSKDNVDKYNYTLNDLKTLALATNQTADYIIVSYGRNKVAINCPDNKLMPTNCITFTAFRDNKIIDFYHYKISNWTRDYMSEDLGLKTGTPVWNNTFFNKEFVYDVVPGSGSNTQRLISIKVNYPF